jgi:hypothetical protein
MSKQITLMGNIDIVPMEAPNPQNPEEMIEGKQIVITDMDTKEQFVYPMEQELANKVGHKLKKSNKGLILELEEERQRAEARAKLAGTVPENGGMPTQEQQNIAQNIMRGVHLKDEPST